MDMLNGAQIAATFIAKAINILHKLLKCYFFTKRRKVAVVFVVRRFKLSSLQCG